jgi:hypothetical protein
MIIQTTISKIAKLWICGKSKLAGVTNRDRAIHLTERTICGAYAVGTPYTVEASSFHKRGHI